MRLRFRRGAWVGGDVDKREVVAGRGGVDKGRDEGEWVGWFSVDRGDGGGERLDILFGVVWCGIG